MLFMVIEHTHPENVEAVGTRFREKGRMMPADVIYHASWIETSGSRCFQSWKLRRQNLYKPGRATGKTSSTSK